MYLTRLTAKAKCSNLNMVIVAGDFNGSFGASSASHGDVTDKAEGAMLAPFQWKGLPDTYMRKTIPHSAIDHVLLGEGSPFAFEGLVSDAGSAMVSDHTILSGFFRLDPVVGAIPRHPPSLPKSPLYKDLGRPEIRDKFVEKVREWPVMSAASAEEAGFTLLRFSLRATRLAHDLTKMGPMRRHGWSPKFVALQAYEQALIHIIRLTRPRRSVRHPLYFEDRIRRIVTEWKKKVIRVAKDPEEYGDLITYSGTSPLAWITLPQREAYRDAVSERIRTVKRLHGRARTEMRMQINDNVRN